MTEDELQGLLLRESNRVDWKARGNPTALTKTLVAFANDYQQVGGGYVLCGVAESAAGQPLLEGVTAAEVRELRDKVFRACRQLTVPPLALETTEVSLGDRPERRILVLQALPTGQVHRFEGKIPIRVDDHTIDARDEEIKLLYQRSAGGSFLEQVERDATRADLDLLAVEQFLEPLKLPHPVEHYLQPGVRIRAAIPPLLLQGAGLTLPPTTGATLRCGTSWNCWAWPRPRGPGSRSSSARRRASLDGAPSSSCSARASGW